MAANVSKRRGGRKARVAARASASVADFGQPRRRVRPYELMDDEGLALIESKADEILRDIGIEFRDDQNAIDAWRAAGATVDGYRVRFEPGMCRAIIQESAPSDFVQNARNPARSVKFGGDSIVMAPNYGPPFVFDEGERRYATIDDFNSFVKLTQASPQLHHLSGPICEPVDTAVTTRHLDMARGHVVYSDKPFMGAVTSPERALDSLQINRIVFGREFADNNPCVINMINPNSPLLYDVGMSETLRHYAQCNQANLVSSFIIAGASGPVTVAGVLAMSLAETMAGMAYAQLVRPGAPVMMGFLMMGMDMRSGAPVRFGETWTGLVIGGQLARRLGVPYRCGGSSTTAKTLDYQAGAESAFYLTYSILSGVNFLIHATGNMEGGLGVSYEKFVLDLDLIGSMHRFLDGIPIDEKSFALDAMREAGPAGNFLGTSHTFDRYESAFFMSDLFDASSFEQWKAAGSADAVARSQRRLEEMLDSYEAPPIEDAIVAELDDFIARRKSELPEMYH